MEFSSHGNFAAYHDHFFWRVPIPRLFSEQVWKRIRYAAHNFSFRLDVFSLPLRISRVSRFRKHSPAIRSGCRFAAAYKLSGNSLIVDYFVNLPNAFVTYLLKHARFPVMKLSSTIAAAVILCVLAAISITLSGVKKVVNDSFYNQRSVVGS